LDVVDPSRPVAGGSYLVSIVCTAGLGRRPDRCCGERRNSARL